jgi:hypothetical protein
MPPYERVTATRSEESSADRHAPVPRQETWLGLVAYLLVGMAGLTLLILALLMLGAWLSRMGM